jgi:hypothetical protein
VSSGSETIGGTIIANSRLSEFGDSESWQHHAVSTRAARVLTADSAPAV